MALHPETTLTNYMYKEWREEEDFPEDSVDVLIHRLEDNIEK